MRFAYTHIRVTDMDLDDGRLVATFDIPEPHRPCTPYFHACAGGISAVPEMLGLPRARVVADLSPRKGVFTISLVESRTLGARLRRASISLVVKTAMAEVERSWTETRRRNAELETTNARLVDLTGRLEVEVERGDRAEAALRAALEPEGGGRTDAGTLFAARLERAAREWRLTPRHIEVAALVVRGLANKEIASRLACAVHTVELHVTEMLKRSGLDSRSALVAAFWSDA
jgi:DNA-binding CsgD family transcriptional regulator